MPRTPVSWTSDQTQAPVLRGPGLPGSRTHTATKSTRWSDSVNPMADPGATATARLGGAVGQRRRVAAADRCARRGALEDARRAGILGLISCSKTTGTFSSSQHDLSIYTSACTPLRQHYGQLSKQKSGQNELKPSELSTFKGFSFYSGIHKQ